MLLPVRKVVCRIVGSKLKSKFGRFDVADCSDPRVKVR